MIELDAGVEHRDLRAARQVGSRLRARRCRGRRFCLSAYCSLDAGVVGVLGDGDRTVVLDALHASLARSRARRSSRLVPSRGATASARTRRSRSARLPPASRTIPSRRASSVFCRNWTSSRVTAGASPRGCASRSFRNSTRAAAGEAIPAATTATTPSTRTRRPRAIAAALLARAGAIRSTPFSSQGAAAYSDHPPPSTVPTPRAWVRAHHHRGAREARCRPLRPLSAAGSPERRRRGRGRPPGRASAGRFRAASRR